jgi:hypothetical protein
MSTTNTHYATEDGPFGLVFFMPVKGLTEAQFEACAREVIAAMSEKPGRSGRALVLKQEEDAIWQYTAWLSEISQTIGGTSAKLYCPDGDDVLGTYVWLPGSERTVDMVPTLTNCRTGVIVVLTDGECAAFAKDFGRAWKQPPGETSKRGELVEDTMIRCIREEICATFDPACIRHIGLLGAGGTTTVNGQAMCDNFVCVRVRVDTLVTDGGSDPTKEIEVSGMLPLPSDRDTDATEWNPRFLEFLRKARTAADEDLPALTRVGKAEMHFI